MRARRALGPIKLARKSTCSAVNPLTLVEGEFPKILSGLLMTDCNLRYEFVHSGR